MPLPAEQAPDESRISAPPLALRDGGWIVYRCAAEHAASVVRGELGRAPARVDTALGASAPSTHCLLLTVPQRAAQEQGGGPDRGGRARGMPRRRAPGFRGGSETRTVAPFVAKERAVVIHVGTGAAERSTEERGAEEPPPE